MHLISFILFVFLVSCSGHTTQQDQVNLDSPIINREGKTVLTRFSPPDKYHRPIADSNSFVWYLRHLPLKPHGTKVQYYDGRTKPNSWVAEAVIDLSVGTKDLQQCADAVIRLRAEYLRASGRGEDISFNFTNGTPAVWSKWKNGYRCSVSGNEVSWQKTADPSDSDKSFHNYLETVFMYAGSLSLDKELVPALLENIQVGYVFIQGGSPGHAVIVVDVAVNVNGEKLFMIAQSYMPAQDIHILVNPLDRNISPWYRLDKGETLYTPEWAFAAGSLKKFP